MFNQKYNDCVMDGGVYVARTGRPKSANPKKSLIGLKLTEDEAAKLREYASKHDMTITQVLQRGIDLQYAMEENQGS